MRTTIQLLDAIKARRGGLSDYALAKILGVHQTTVSRYRTGRDYLGPETALKVAELLEIDAGYVLCCASAERAKRDPERAVWQGLAARFEKAEGGGVCITSTRRRGNFFALSGSILKMAAPALVF